MLDVKFSRIATDITSQISLTLKILVPDLWQPYSHCFYLFFFFDKLLGNEVRNSDQ